MTALRQQITAYINANLSPAARSAELARMAIEMREGLISSGKASPVYRTFVDGQEGAPESKVRGTGGGSILYEFVYAAQAVTYALGFLFARSTGVGDKFRHSFFISVDGGAPMAVTAFDPARAAHAREIIIGNFEPYNRKVDVQIAGGHRVRFSTPVGLFDDAARAVKREFRGVVNASRLNRISFSGQYILLGQGKTGAKGRPVDTPGLQLIPAVA